MTVDSIPYSLPDRNSTSRDDNNGDAVPTLIQLVDKQYRNDPAFRVSSRDGEDSKGENKAEKITTTPIENALFFAGSLTMLHFTLDVLVYHQYGQEVEWSNIWWRTAKSFPC